MSSLPLPYFIRFTTITLLRTNVWAACPCRTTYVSLLLHYYVLLCEQLALALRHTRYYYYITTYYCVSSLPLPYGIRVTTITLLRTTVWAVCLCLTAYALVLLCNQLALALRHTRYYYYMTAYCCVSSVPLPYGIRVSNITLLRTTVWAACPCPTSYALQLLHYYLLLCEQLAVDLRYTRYYVLLCEQLPLPYGIRVTTITWLRTTVWAACPCPTSYALLLLHYYVLLCEQLALAIQHTRYYYYMTSYYCVSSLPLPYGIRVTTITLLRTTVWTFCPCHTAYALLLLCEQLALALWHTRYYY